MTEREKRMRSYEATMIMLRTKYPCRGCIYYAACGDRMRTEPCNGKVEASVVRARG